MTCQSLMPVPLWSFGPGFSKILATQHIHYAYPSHSCDTADYKLCLSHVMHAQYRLLTLICGKSYSHIFIYIGLRYVIRSLWVIRTDSPFHCVFVGAWDNWARLRVASCDHGGRVHGLSCFELPLEAERSPQSKLYMRNILTRLCVIKHDRWRIITMVDVCTQIYTHPAFCHFLLPNGTCTTCATLAPC